MQTTDHYTDRPGKEHFVGRGIGIVQKGRFPEAMALALILFLALVLRLWGLDQNGWGAEYYTAAVRSMAMNWHNFLYNAFDPTGFISIDKPPVAIWLQVAGVKMFGFHPLSVLLPQVLEGVGSVWLLFHIVRRRFGSSAGLLSAFFLAITPIWVAVNRTNNTDSCLVLVLLLAAWALLKAAEEGNRNQLFLSAALIGLAFNVKMLAAYVVLPTFFAVYFFGAPHHWRRRIMHLGLAMIIVVVTSLPWVLLYDLTPREDRPFVGGSRQNSMLELVVGHNAMNRFVSPAKRFALARDEKNRQVKSPTGEPPVEPRVEREERTVTDSSRLFVRTPTGLLRLADGQLAAQAGWLFPFAVAALIVGARQIPFRRPLNAMHLNLLFWCCWILTYVGVYSYLGGIMHFYYLATMAPALAALAGIGIAGFSTDNCQRSPYAGLLPATLLVTAAWQIYIQVSALGWPLIAVVKQPVEWLNWLHGVLIGGTMIAAAVLIFLYFRPVANQVTRIRNGALTLGVLALLVIPFAWTLSAVLLPVHGLLPSADLYRTVAVSRSTNAHLRTRAGQFSDTTRLPCFLMANRDSERYLMAASTTQLAAPIIIGTGQAVLARGGFHGLDPAVTPETLAQMVKTKQVRFVMLDDIAVTSRRMGARVSGKQVADWVRANGTLVDPALWRGTRMQGSTQLYDLRPEVGLVLTSSTTDQCK
jgi:4-amino-4-deoxy-L-arabinose transferase-like glycosyltransferase